MDKVNQQVPSVTSEPPAKASKNLSFAKALAYGFVVVSVGISIAVGGYLFGLNKNKTQPASQVSVPTTIPTSGQNQTVNSAYKTKLTPVNASAFEKSIVSVDNCNNPVGLIVYHDKVTDSRMKINNILLSGNTYSKEGLNDVLVLLNGKTQYLQDVKSSEMAFRDYCGGAYHYLIKELNGITYPNTDKNKALMVLGGQGLYGGIEIVVYAQRGNDVIQLSKFLYGTREVYDQYIKACESESGSENFKAANDCYNQALTSDKNIEKDAVTVANKLVQLFLIQ